MDIVHDNIIYIRDYSEIGGVETYVYELCKKYKDLDIAVVYKMAHPRQIQRIRQFCKAYKHTNQKIICKVAVINYDTTIIDYITEDIWKENLKPGDKRGIYQGIHGDYYNCDYGKPPTDPRIKSYIGITKYICKTFKEMTGCDNVILSYNPLSVEDKPYLKLISATRLSELKGSKRMIKLMNALDEAGIDYIWYIFTNSPDTFNNPNVIFMKSRLDVTRWIKDADYLVQLSDTEACSVAVNEALYRNIPVIVTPLPYLEEIGVEDGKNAYILNFDCSNMDHIIQNIWNIPKFKFEPMQDRYNEILAEGKSRYEEEKNMIVKVKAIKWPVGVKDAETGKYHENGDVWETNKERADFLVENGAVEIVKTTVVKPEEPKVEPVKEETKPKKKKKIDTKK